MGLETLSETLMPERRCSGVALLLITIQNYMSTAPVRLHGLGVFGFSATSEPGRLGRGICLAEEKVVSFRARPHVDSYFLLVSANF
jgi:hypothetical protein